MYPARVTTRRHASLFALVLVGAAASLAYGCGDENTASPGATDGAPTGSPGASSGTPTGSGGAGGDGGAGGGGEGGEGPRVHHAHHLRPRVDPRAQSPGAL